jgi:CHAT domain-containing protein
MTNKDTMQSASDYIVSSYIPTLSALSKSRADWSPVPCDKLGGILAACRSSPGWSSLDSVAREIEVTKTRFENASVHVVHVSSPNTTVQMLRQALEGEGAHMLHLACHGMQAESPLDSAFLLSDGRLTIQGLMSTRLPNAVLAF